MGESGGDGKNRSGNLALEGRKNANVRPFDLEEFHRLRIERIDNQRRAEQQRSKWFKQKSYLRKSPNSSYRSIDILSQKVTPRRTFEVHLFDKLTRQELGRLGKRHASYSPESNRSSSENQSMDCMGIVCHSPPSLHNNSTTPHSIPMKGSSHHKEKASEVTLVTRGEKLTSHYLLLARTHSSPVSMMKLESQGGDGNTIFDTDEGSSSESCSTPAPTLHAVSAHCNGEIGDGCEDRQLQRDCTQDENDHSFTICRAHLSMSDTEETSSGKLDDVSMSLSEADAGKFSLAQQHKNLQIVVKCLFLSTLIIAAGGSLLSCWKFVARSKLTYHEVSLFTLFPGQEVQSWVDMGKIRIALCSIFDRRTKQIIARQCQITSSFLSQAKAHWVALKVICKKCTSVIDMMLSFIIESIYHLDKLHVHETYSMAWNMTLSATLACRHFVNSAELSRTSLEHGHNDIIIQKATITAPFHFCENNATLLLLESTGDAKPAHGHSSGHSNYWGKTFRGTTFVRVQSPTNRNDFRSIHGIPPVEAPPGPIDQSAADWRTMMSQSMSELQHTKKRFDFPLIGLGQHRVSLGLPDSIAIAHGSYGSLAASMPMQRPAMLRQPWRQGGMAEPQPNKRRSSNALSYPMPGLAHEADIFDIDVMDMAGEFILKLLRRSSKFGKRHCEDDNDKTY